jgi:fibronectin-binding autotransporter adhesin
MKKLLFRIAGILAALSAPLLVGGVAHAGADICTWTGGGSDENFSTAANWSVCDNGTVPESGDTLVFPTSVDSDTTTGDDRELNNDLTTMSFAGISVSGDYATGDTDYYSINGNSFTMTGDIQGNPNDEDSPLLYFSTDIIVNTSPMTIAAVRSSGSLSIGANALELKASSFSGGLTGSGGVTVRGADNPLPGGLGAGGPTCGAAGASSPFGGNSSGFSGFVNVIDYAVSVSSRANDLLNNASGVTLDAGSTLAFNIDNGTDMTFNTPLALNGGYIVATQTYDSGCDAPTDFSTLTINGGTVATADVIVAQLWDVNIVIGGSITGPSFFGVEAGISSVPSLTVGSTVLKSALRTVTITGNQSATSPSIQENNLYIVSAGATLGDVSVTGGTLKGTGTIGTLDMSDGIVAPGLSPGCLASGDLTYSGGTLEIEIDGATACTEYDQQTVTGAVALGTATTLDIARLTTYIPALNSTYTIISNDASDAVTGTFDGLAQGAEIVVDGVTYTISYTGGDGNDVVLTVTAVDESVGAPNTGAHIIRSGILLPIIAILSAAAIIYMNFVATKKK